MREKQRRKKILFQFDVLLYFLIYSKGKKENKEFKKRKKTCLYFKRTFLFFITFFLFSSSLENKTFLVIKL